MLNETFVKALLNLSNAAWTVEMTGELMAFAMVVCFAGLSNLEIRFPKIKRPAEQTHQSYRINIGMFVFNSILLSACSISTLYVIAQQYSGFGLLNYVPSPAIRAVLAFLAFDLLLYLWHQVCHRVDAFWMFHRVHHNDPYLNVSTAFRLHFVEVLITNSLKALLIILLGIDKTLVLVIETIITLCILFHHTNTSFRFERVLGLVLIVPSLHRVHHSVERSEHDSNYGATLSLWDRLFGTLSELEPKKIGINGRSPQDLFNLFNLVKFGLGLGIPAPIRPTNLDVMIAEAAYYKAEKRNFRPGDDIRDWLEAKAEILNQVYGKNSHQGRSQTNWWNGFLPNF